MPISTNYPSGRSFLSFDYFTDGEDLRHDKIKTIKSPVGSDQSPITIYRFDYRYPKKIKDPRHTEVYDAYNHKTTYKYDVSSRLMSIKKYTGTSAHSAYNCERFYWGAIYSTNEANLLSQTLEKASGKILCCHSYHYDGRGNVEQEQIWGNITGRGCPPVEMNGNYPSDNGCECYRIVRKYSQDGFNLLLEELEPNGKKSIYKYVPSTNLLESKFTFGGKGICLREFRQYDQNAVLVCKIQDNGTAESQQDLTGVTQRLITSITPQSSGSGIGLPKIIEESYLDLSTSKERLLRKTVCNMTAKHELYKEICMIVKISFTPLHS